jgi:hypothetical protein
MGRFLIALVALAVLAGAEGAPTTASPATTAPALPFALKVGNLSFTEKVGSLSVMPGDEIDLRVDGGGSYRLEAEGGSVQARGASAWRWRAPLTPGRMATITVEDARKGREIDLNVFVLVPIAHVKAGVLNGYRIGTYPEKTRPQGFVEVTTENIRTKVSPHFELRQFLCKQAGGFPKYVVLSEALILKLERIVEALDRAGHDVDTLHVMSGYRTPYYNERIGNVRDSQHTAGTAADIFVDDRPDGRMDDLDRDGIVTRDDAIWLFRLVDGMDRAPGGLFRGGLGDYGSTPAHGPFVHVDVRGRLARWRG